MFLIYFERIKKSYRILLNSNVQMAFYKYDNMLLDVVKIYDIEYSF